MTDQTATLSVDEELAQYRAKFGPLDAEPKPATTHVLMIVDMSGSMEPLADDVRGGFNTYVTDLAKEAGNYRLTACLFDTEFIPLCTDAALADVPRLTTRNYVPRAGTALRDAVGKTVHEFDLRVTLADGDRVLVVIQTDGEENSSREYTWEAIRTLIKDREATGVWSFIYLGAGMDTWAQASQMGVQPGSYVHTSASRVGTRSTYGGLTRGTAAFAAGASGATVSHTVKNTPGAVDDKDA